MPGQNPATDWVPALLAFLFYANLFYQTIRRHRQNRPVVLAVLFFVMIIGLGIAASLGGQPLLQRVVGGASMLLAVAILFFIFRDVLRWFRSKKPFHADSGFGEGKSVDSI